jgi:zinc transport system ATP-binding protein
MQEQRLCYNIPAMPAKKSPIIHAEHVTFQRDGEVIVDDFSFAINIGDYVAILGPNGGGKSTLLKLMMGLLKPQSGAITVYHTSPLHAAKSHRLAYVPQHGGLLELHIPATVEEIVTSMQRSKDIAHAQDIMRELDIFHLRQQTVAALSGGERQRVILARALATKPEILFLDEPTDSLDVKSQELFHNLLKHLNKKNVTILYVTHDAHSIAKETNAALCIKHDLVCHGDNACLVRGKKLQNLYHANKQELEHHHHIDYV